MPKKIELTLWEAILGHCLEKREIDSINAIIQKVKPGFAIRKQRKDAGKPREYENPYKNPNGN